jgi:threonine 3-dehydrogenase
MKAIRKMKPAPGAEILDVPIPVPGKRDLLVKVKATALCKSDVDIYEWIPLVQGKFNPPYTMGHEFAGEVVETGELVTGFAKGDKVAGETHIPCGTCRECRTGLAHICTNHMGVLGRTCDGAFAEYILLPEVSAIRLAPGIDFASGSLYEPMGTAIHSLQKANVSGKNIAIIGPGTIGLMACEAAKAMGASAVIAVGSSPHRLDYSLKIGADMAINWKEKDFVQEVKNNFSQLDAVIDMTGNPALIDKSIDALSTAGTLVLVGMIDAELSIPRYMYRVVYRELRITGIYGRHMYTSWDILDNLVRGGRIKLDHYVGEQLPLCDYQKGLEHFSKLIGRAVLLPGE